MIFGFTRKLFISLLVTNLVLLLVMASIMYYSFQTSASTDLQLVETKALTNLSIALSEAYNHKESWSFLEHDLVIWGFFLQFLPGGKFEDAAEHQIRPQVTHFLQHPPRSRRPLETLHNLPMAHAPRPDTSSLTARIRLLDREANIIIGSMQESEATESTQLPIVVGDTTVGWLSVAPIPWLERSLKEHFQSKLLSTLLISGAVGLFISLLVAIPFGRTIVRPIRKVITGVSKISDGDLSSSIAWNSKDEMGELINNVNNLATTLQATEKLRQSMMADISHELRTPLAVLQAEIEAMQDGIRSCDSNQLSSLHKNVSTLAKLVEDLFVLSLSDSGAPVCKKEKLNLSELLVRNLDLYRTLFEQKNIKVNSTVESKEIIVKGDPVRLSQVFSNLFNNSYHYTNQNGDILVDIKQEQERVIVIIEDSYPGVPASEIHNIFTRFYRIDKSRSRSRGGAGIGLALSKTLIEGHEGSIQASPSEMGGICMAVTLPAYK